MPQTAPPVHVEILEPQDGTQVPANHVVILRASASAGSEDLGDQIRWRSNRDGFLGQGGEVTVQLTAGRHRLRAGVRLPAEKLERSSSTRRKASRDSETDSGDFAKDVVTVHAVPVDYPEGDT